MMNSLMYLALEEITGELLYEAFRKIRGCVHLFHQYEYLLYMKSRNIFSFILFSSNMLCIYYVLDTMLGVGYLEINDSDIVRIFVEFIVYK